MPERVIPLDLGVEWEPNAPSAVLFVRDDGMAQLALQAHSEPTLSLMTVIASAPCRFTTVT